MPPGDVSWDEAWRTALDDLELHLHHAERVLHGDEDHLPPWYPPTLAVPLPPALGDRARTLLARQQDVAARLGVAALGTRRQLEVVARVDRATTASTAPAYVDVRG